MSLRQPAGNPDGTRFFSEEAALRRRAALAKLRALYASWGYLPLEVPALERFDPHHPRESQSFKLADRDGGVLALRSDFTPAVARWVASRGGAAGESEALRLSYDGPVWHFIDPEFARAREFTQVGIELVGVSNARADAELIHLARESVRSVGLVPRVEVGNPAYVRALLEAAGIPAAHEAAVADAIDRKDRSDLEALVAELGVAGAAAAALLAAPDLYGGPEVLEEAKATAPSPSARAALRRLKGVIEEFEDPSELLLDLGMARRLSYYTGVTFRVYTYDFGQPLLGGGRYDGSLLLYAAGFSLGLERLLAAVDHSGGDAFTAASNAPLAAAPIYALDDVAARRLRAAGWQVVRALSPDRPSAEREALAAGAGFLIVDAELIELAAGGERHEAYRETALALARTLAAGSADGGAEHV